MRTVEWDYQSDCLRMIDQRRLPAELIVVSFDDYHQVAAAIQEMVVRGAPAIGAAAAFGLALAAQKTNEVDRDRFGSELERAADVLRKSRPTAVNLAWALRRILDFVNRSKLDARALRSAILDEAQRIADEDVEINRRMAVFGADLLDDGDTVIHHCNTGALATVDWGTALGVIRMAHEMGKHIHVLVDETRPRLQGSRLTAWELEQYGIPYEIICDGAAGYFLRHGQAQKVLFGGDRMAANGDVANKIGTYMLALAAKDNSVPVYTVVPLSTVDLTVKSGEEIPIEERHPDEVLSLQVGGSPVVPSHASARNPAFDVTPHRLLTAIITEKGVVYPPFDINLTQIIKGAF